MNPTAELIQPEVQELVREGRFSELRAALRGLPSADLADVVMALEPDEAAILFRFLPRDDAGEVFAYLPQEKQEELIGQLGASAVRVIEGMDVDDRARLLDELPTEVAQRLIGSLNPEERRQTQAILGYPAESVGRLMTPDYVRIRREWTVAEAMAHVRRYGRDAETINVVYVVGEAGELVGEVRLRQLLLAEPSAFVESVMDRNVVALRADQDQEEAVRQLTRYDRVALPVLDTRGSLLGIVTHDDVADVAQEEATEDIHRIGGLEALDQPYMETGLGEMYRKRGFWLSALFVGQGVTILALKAFEDTIDRAAVLAVFLPLVISCGGNSGSQAATLVTRAVALGEVGMGDGWRILRHELATSALLAASLGALGLASVLVFNGLVFPALGWEVTGHPVRLAVAVALAIAGVVLWGTMVGSLLPLVLKRFGFDPATASSPLVATLMDASGTVLYLAMALAILRGTLL
ncbi:MAG TPA: magnesium transporter [Phycisphaerales bacterium]|nr:magnesium transporter [Phycisphaerales bacterium]